MDLDLLLKNSFIVLKVSLILPLIFDNLVAKYYHLSFMLRLLTLFLKCRKELINSVDLFLHAASFNLSLNFLSALRSALTQGQH